MFSDAIVVVVVLVATASANQTAVVLRHGDGIAVRHQRQRHATGNGAHVGEAGAAVMAQIVMALAQTPRDVLPGDGRVGEQVASHRQDRLENTKEKGREGKEGDESGKVKGQNGKERGKE